MASSNPTSSAGCARCGKPRAEHRYVAPLPTLQHWYCYDFTPALSWEDANAEFVPPASAPAATPEPRAPKPHIPWTPDPRFDPTALRRADVLALEATCERCGQAITNPTTGIIAGDCAYCGGRMVATRGAWSMSGASVPPATVPADARGLLGCDTDAASVSHPSNPMSRAGNSVAPEQPGSATRVVNGPWFDVPAGTRPAQCRSCYATIYWIRTDGGKRMPVDCHVECGTLPFKGVPGDGEQDGRGVSHFATCRDADTWRQRR